MSAQSQTLVLITGANQGIGFEIAKKLGTEHKDYHIIVSGRRPEALESAVAKLRDLGCSVESLTLDQASDESVAQAHKAVKEKHGRLDVLINNAGVNQSGPYDPAKGKSREEWMTVFNTNLFGVSAVTEAFLPLLKASQKTKRIVFMTSDLGSAGNKVDPTYYAHKLDVRIYSCTKAALNMLALHFATQFEDDPTWKINLCCPGYCATNLNKFRGEGPPSDGAINACRLATLGPDGDTATYSNRHGTIPW